MLSIISVAQIIAVIIVNSCSRLKTKEPTETFKVLDVATEGVEVDVALVDDNIQTVPPLRVRRP